jgi:hypothetical protein
MAYKDKGVKERYALLFNERRKGLRLKTKIRLLTHYGKDGHLRCCWPDCGITDIDLLTLDHVNNDGHLEGRNRSCVYEHFSEDWFPVGEFQTLCWNHQWKKELLRRRTS